MIKERFKSVNRQFQAFMLIYQCLLAVEICNRNMHVTVLEQIFIWHTYNLILFSFGVREIDKTMLRKFLRFCTGSPYMSLSIQFILLLSDIAVIYENFFTIIFTIFIHLMNMSQYYKMEL